MRRLTGAVAAATAVVLTTTACSGSDDGDKTDDEPSLGAPTTSAPDGDEKVEIRAAIAAYDRALVTVNRKQEVTPQLEAVTTEEWAEQLLTTYDNNLFSNGLQMVGRWRSEVRTVAVDGDNAEAAVCADGTKVYVVEGESIPSGAQSQGRRRGVIALVREDDGWQVDGNATEESQC